MGGLSGAGTCRSPNWTVRVEPPIPGVMAPRVHMPQRWRARIGRSVHDMSRLYTSPATALSWVIWSASDPVSWDVMLRVRKPWLCQEARLLKRLMHMPTKLPTRSLYVHTRS